MNAETTSSAPTVMAMLKLIFWHHRREKRHVRDQRERTQRTDRHDRNKVRIKSATMNNDDDTVTQFAPDATVVL
jgi:hypothetical protein